MPSTAVDVRAESPCVRYSTANMITPAPTTATASGTAPGQDRRHHELAAARRSWPRAPPAAASPRQRRAPAPPRRTAPRATRAAPALVVGPAGRTPGRPGRRPDQLTTTGSSTANTGVPGSRGTTWTRSLPARGPSVMCTTSAVQAAFPSPSAQSAACVAITSPRTGCCIAAAAVGGGPPVGRSRTSPTSAASAHGPSRAASSSRTRRPAGAAGEWPCPWPCPWVGPWLGVMGRGAAASITGRPRGSVAGSSSPGSTTGPSCAPALPGLRPGLRRPRVRRTPTAAAP